jgi:hypothetical protein
MLVILYWGLRAASLIPVRTSHIILPRVKPQPYDKGPLTHYQTPRRPEATSTTTHDYRSLLGP